MGERRYPWDADGVIHAPGTACDFDEQGKAGRQGVVNGLCIHTEALCAECFDAEQMAALYRDAAEQLETVGQQKVSA